MALRTAANRRASARFLAPESLRLLLAELLLELLVARPFDFDLLLLRLAAGRFLAAAKAAGKGMMPVNTIKLSAMIKGLFLVSHMLNSPSKQPEVNFPCEASSARLPCDEAI